MNTTGLSPAELEHVLVPLRGAVANARTESAGGKATIAPKASTT